jgi:hypothetical protein
MRFIITATDAATRATEAPPVRENQPYAVFTNAVIDTLRSGAAIDGSKDAVTVRQLYDAVRERVLQDTNQRQEPQLLTSGPNAGDLIIAAAPLRPLPPDIVALMGDADAQRRMDAPVKLGRLLRYEGEAWRKPVRQALKTLAKDFDRRVVAEAKDALRLHFTEGEGAIVRPAVPKPETRKAGERFADTLKSGGEGPAMVVIPAGEFLLAVEDHIDATARAVDFRD